MEPEHLSPYYRKSRIKLAWYGELKLVVVVGLAIYFIVQGLIFFLPSWVVAVVTLLAMSAHLVGMVFDYYSTCAFLQYRPAYESRGLEFPCQEGNILLTHANSLQQFFVSLPTLFSILMLPGIWFLPGIGLGMGVGRLLVGASNLYLADQMAADLRSRETSLLSPRRQRERHPMASSVYSSDCYC